MKETGYFLTQDDSSELGGGLGALPVLVMPHLPNLARTQSPLGRPVLPSHLHTHGMAQTCVWSMSPE